MAQLAAAKSMSLGGGWSTALGLCFKVPSLGLPRASYVPSLKVLLNTYVCTDVLRPRVVGSVTHEKPGAHGDTMRLSQSN